MTDPKPLLQLPVDVAYMRSLTAGGRITDLETFFGPLSPLQPLAPPSTAGRQFDYMPGVNLVTTPGLGEVNFHQLRALADNYDLMRLVIETRKDQAVNQRWDIVRRDRSRNADPRTQQAKDFLAYPDKEHSWEQWARMLVEDMLVIDAATIYPRKTNDGQPYSLDLVDGGTIKRVLDDYGRTPMPPQPAYQQVLKGLPATNYTRDELLYVPRNLRTHEMYGMSPVRQVQMSVNIAMRRQLHQLEFYTQGTVPDAICSVPETWTLDQIKEFQIYWDALNTDNTAERRKVRFVPAGIAKGFVQTKQDALKDEMDEWLARIVCYAFSVSAQWAAKMMNRATAESAHEQAQSEGLAPLLMWLKSVIDRVLAQVFGWPDLELLWLEEEAQDPVEQSTVLDKYLRNAGITLNELRAAIGREGIGPMGDIHMIYTATGAVPLEVALKPPEPPPPQLGHNGGPPLDDDQAGGEGGGDQAEQQEEQLTKAADRKDARQARLTGLWTKFFADAAPRVADAITGADVLAKADDDDTVPAPEDEPDDSSDPGPAAEAAIDKALAEQPWHHIEAETSAILQEEATAGIADGIVAAGITDDGITALANPRAVVAAQDQAADLVSGISEVTRARLRALVTEAQDEGWSAQKLSDAIKENESFTPKRADLIAKHELATSSIQGNLAAWRAANKKYGLDIRKKTILGLNENHCPICLAANREGAIPLDEGFAGLGDAPFHPNCGCGEVPVQPALAKAWNPDQPRDSGGRWTSNPGAALDREIKRGKAHIEQMLHTHHDALDAMNVPQHGKISFLWGQPGNPQRKFKGGYGVSHIVAKRNAEGLDGEEVAKKMPEVIAKGTASAPYGPAGAQRVNITHDGHTAVLSQWHTGASGRWLLTGWK
jgi:hypothetical protein